MNRLKMGVRLYVQMGKYLPCNVYSAQRIELYNYSGRFPCKLIVEIQKATSLCLPAWGCFSLIMRHIQSKDMSFS